MRKIGSGSLFGGSENDDGFGGSVLFNTKSKRSINSLSDIGYECLDVSPNSVLEYTVL